MQEAGAVRTGARTALALLSLLAALGPLKAFSRTPRAADTSKEWLPVCALGRVFFPLNVVFSST